MHLADAFCQSDLHLVNYQLFGDSLPSILGLSALHKGKTVAADIWAHNFPDNTLARFVMLPPPLRALRGCLMVPELCGLSGDVCPSLIGNIWGRSEINKTK